jgi:DNA processing protein
LAALGVSPARLRRLLRGGDPAAAFEALAAGTHPEDRAGRLRQAVGPDLVEDVARRCAAAGVEVLVHGEPGYPAALAQDDEAPAVLFARGQQAAAEVSPRVAVVGTRSATPSGLAAARELGRDLAAAGVLVVSGLALGIDSAVLSGCTDTGAGALAVLGAAHDGAATPEQQRLQEQLTRRGLVLSELPPGTVSARWRFATRNRIMAALAQLVVVVECHRDGGALHTVRAAVRRGVPVAAVPGSVRSPASVGTNALLVGGAACVRHGADVLELLRAGPVSSATDVVAAPPARRRPRTRGRPRRPPVPTSTRQGVLAVDGVLEAVDYVATSFEEIVQASGAAVGEVAMRLEHLAAAGLVVGSGGWWWRAPDPAHR